MVPGLDPLGLDLLHQMLQYDPDKRIRCRQALAHAWFDDIRCGCCGCGCCCWRAGWTYAAAVDADACQMVAARRAAGTGRARWSAVRGAGCPNLLADAQEQAAPECSLLVAVPGATLARFMSREVEEARSRGLKEAMRQAEDQTRACMAAAALTDQLLDCGEGGRGARLAHHCTRPSTAAACHHLPATCLPATCLPATCLPAICLPPPAGTVRSRCHLPHLPQPISPSSAPVFCLVGGLHPGPAVSTMRPHMAGSCAAPCPAEPAMTPQASQQSTLTATSLPMLGRRGRG